MANSKYEYIKSFEHHVKLLPNTFLVVRIDGRGFHQVRFSLSAKFGLEKPNDRRALDLMNAAARAVLQEIPDISLAYGMSDEFRSRHINNLYNTAFWALVQKGGMLPTKAEETLKGSVAADKNEILFSRFGMNYNDELEQFKKGSVMYRDYANETTGLLNTAPPKSPQDEPSRTQKEKGKKRRRKAEITLQFTDLIRDEFWNARPWLFLDG
ncbi:MAG: hypothetical protein Q9210_000290 [Variospora velana]